MNLRKSDVKMLVALLFHKLFKKQEKRCKAQEYVSRLTFARCRLYSCSLYSCRLISCALNHVPYFCTHENFDGLPRQYLQKPAGGGYFTGQNKKSKS